MASLELLCFISKFLLLFFFLNLECDALSVLSDDVAMLHNALPRNGGLHIKLPKSNNNKKYIYIYMSSYNVRDAQMQSAMHTESRFENMLTVSDDT